MLNMIWKSLDCVHWVSLKNIHWNIGMEIGQRQGKWGKSKENKFEEKKKKGGKIATERKRNESQETNE